MQMLKRLGSLISNPKFCRETLWPESDLKATWVFWFVWNSVLVLLLTVAVFSALKVASPHLQQEVDLLLPDFDIEISQGKLRTSLEDPRVFSTESEIIVLDTKQVAYTPEVLAGYDYGLFVTETGLRLKAQEEQMDLELQFKDFEDQAWSKDRLFAYWDKHETQYLIWLCLAVGLVFALTIIGFGLVFCLGGALVTWGIGLAMSLPDWPFYKNLAAWMHYFALFAYLQVILVLWTVPPVVAMLICLGLLGWGLYSVMADQKSKA